MQLFVKPARKLATLTFAILLSFLGTGLVQLNRPQPAYAVSDVDIRILVPVTLRSAPTTKSSQVAVIFEDYPVDYICYTTGESVGGTNLWFQVRDRHNEKRGYYSSFYDSMPYSIWQQRRIELQYGIPQCLSLDVSSSWPAQPQPSVSQPYNRWKAIYWALNHAQESQPAFFASCTWFVSKALWAGGITPDAQWNSEGRRGLVVPGTSTATAASHLTDYNVP